MTLTALFAVEEEKAFHVGLAGIRDAFELERTHPPYTCWFNGIPDAKARVQKGQVTPRADRPPVTLPFSFTYANSNDCWTAEGMSIIYQEENDIQDAKDAQGRECKLRVLKVTPGGERLYIGLLRLPDGSSIVSPPMMLSRCTLETTNPGQHQSSRDLFLMPAPSITPLH